MSRKEFLLNEALEIKRHLLLFLRHPLIEIKQLPDWTWGRLLALEIALAALTSVIAGLTDKKIMQSVLLGLFTSPILILIPLSICSLFFYYCFQIFAARTVSYRRLFTLVLFASAPLLVFQTVANLVPPITVIGMAFSSLLLLVGLVENFQLEKKMAIRWIASLFVLFFVLWIWNQLRSARWEKDWSPDRYEAPEVELGK